MRRWVPITMGVAAIGGMTAVGAVALAERRWNAGTAALRARLLAAAPSSVRRYDAAELDGLPPPVVRFFRRVLSPGQPLIVHARLQWSGQFNMGEPGREQWAPFAARQDFVPGAPGMVWDARIRMSLGVPVLVRDALVEGVGSMQGAVLGLIPVANAAGTPQMAAASLQRYLGEAAWFPTALLPSQGVRWTPIDDRRALATTGVGAVTASVEFRFHEDDLVASVFVPDRLFDDRRHPPTPRAWQARILTFTMHDGLVIPRDAIVEWLLPGGAFAYWRARPESVEYTYAID